jgi:L-aspartate oxidase
MTTQAGVLRTDAGLRGAAKHLAELSAGDPGRPETADWEATNLLTVATGLTLAAHAREETRGSHARAEFAESDPALDGRHTVFPAGSETPAFVPWL